MSTTTMSPARSSRSEHSWCGSAPCGPDPTMMNATSECPSATMACAMSAATSASVRPGTRNSGTRACTRSIAAPALRSASISAASLIIRSRRSTSVASTGTTPSTSASGRRCSAGMASVTCDACQRPACATERVGHQPVRIVAVDPVPHRQRQFGHRRLLQRRQFHPRHHHGRLAGGGQHQRGQPLEGLRTRADQVAQVVARGDDQARQAGIGRCRGGRPQALRVYVGVESAELLMAMISRLIRSPDSWRPRSGCRRDPGSSATSSGPARRSSRRGPR